MRSLLLLSILALSTLQLFSNQLTLSPKNWLGQLDARLSLSELSIPGTHNSCALRGGLYSACQSLNFKQQLEAGVRFFDIRCRHLNNSLQIYHGPIDQQISFDDVHRSCLTFLKQNPAETLILSIKEESTPKHNTRHFGQTFSTHLQLHPKIWYSKREIPTLQQVRGKIVIVSRHSQVSGIPWNDLHIQDRYKIPLDQGVAKKWQLFHSQLVRSHSAPSHQWHINFLSGTSLLTPPKPLALQLNKKLATLLTPAEKKRHGTLLLDFPSATLIRQIYQSNFAESTVRH